jgi:hypothetical protein
LQEKKKWITAKQLHPDGNGKIRELHEVNFCFKKFENIRYVQL